MRPRLIDRNGKVFTEDVPSWKGIEWLYGIGHPKRGIARAIAVHPLFSRLIAIYQTSRFSRKGIDPFIKRFGIDLNEFKVPKGGYPSFDAFFTRELKDGARPIAASKVVMPCDGRYRAVDPSKKIILKGARFNLKELLGRFYHERFLDGEMVMARLAPPDYHRVHMPIDSYLIDHEVVGKSLFSVQPLAMEHPAFDFGKQWRHLSLFETEKGLPWMMLEVGATCIGSVVQLLSRGEFAKKGALKSYFRFGGSLVILLFPKDFLILDKTLKEASKGHLELIGKVGEPLSE